VDTGFDEAMGKKRQREMIKPVRDGLAALGIAADAIKTVIISHLHYDHCGNYDLFPKARYHLQDREMAYATGRCMCHQALRAPFEVEDWWPWCGRFSRAAPLFTRVSGKSYPASPCITSAAIPKGCKACG